jgi:hypothetical protein
MLIKKVPSFLIASIVVSFVEFKVGQNSKTYLVYALRNPRPAANMTFFGLLIISYKNILHRNIVFISQSNNTGNPLISEITVTDITPAN